MKKYFTIFFLISLSITISWGKDFSFNLETLKKGSQAERNIWIVNTSDKPLYILSVETGCVCTKASFNKKSIEVGDSSRIDIKFSAKDPGVFFKVITIKTTDKDCDSKVTLRGKVN